MEYHGKVVHTIELIQHIAIMSRIEICYSAWRPGTQTAAPTLPGFQGLKRCIPYIASHYHKLIFYPFNYYDGSYVTMLIYSWTQAEDYNNHNCIEFHQYADHSIILNIRPSVLGIIHTVLGVSSWYKVHIKPSATSYYTDWEISYMYKAVKKNKTIWRYMEALEFQTGAPTVHW